MIDEIFSSPYFQLCMAIMLCLVIAFCNDISLLYNAYVVAAIFAIMVLMIYTDINDEYGIVLLLIALFVLSYNNVVTKPSSNEEKAKG